MKRVLQRSPQDPPAEMLLAGDATDGETVHVSAGADGLIVGERVSRSGKPRSEDAVLH